MTNTPFSIDQLHTDLLQKKYSIVSLLDEYLSRIGLFDNKLNSFITVSSESAYKKAKEMEEALENNPHSIKEFPLLGVVIALKDMYLTKGIRTTAGSKLLSNYVPQYSSSVVEKLEGAGAIVIGKTNCDAWAHGGSGENSDFGPSKNPWNTNYVPGGSSSGSAVAVSASFSLAAMGTDTGGSIRLPASFTNLVGFKPTYGAVSRYGVVAMASSLDSMGHFTRTVEDAETIFKVTKGEDMKDGTVKNFDLKQLVLGRKLKIGIPKEYFGEGLEFEVEKKVRDVISWYEKQGIETVEVSLPHTRYAISVYYIVQPAEVASNLGRYDGVRYGDTRSSFGNEAKRRIMLGTYVLSSGYYDAYYNKAQKVRSLLIQDFENAFEQVDAIISPVCPTPPFPIGQKVNDPLSMYLADIYTVAANLVGIPGISIPAGFSEMGLPIGFQLLGPRFGESTLFELGKMYQKENSWHKEQPKL